MNRLGSFLACLLLINLAVSAVAVEHRFFWTTGDRLLPAWGFYPNGSSYGDTAPSGKVSAWTAGGGTHALTWVAGLPRPVRPTDPHAPLGRHARRDRRCPPPPGPRPRDRRRGNATERGQSSSDTGSGPCSGTPGATGLLRSDRRAVVSVPGRDLAGRSGRCSQADGGKGMSSTEPGPHESADPTTVAKQAWPHAKRSTHFPPFPKE
jgi:hypothetical protein